MREAALTHRNLWKEHETDVGQFRNAARTAARSATLKALRRRGLALVSYSPAEYVHRRRAEILRRERINLALDVGANVGQHGQRLRGEGYASRIASFEPHGESFGQLLAAAEADDLWEAHRLAIADTEGELRLNVSADPRYNSVLDAVDDEVPTTTGNEMVRCATLDSLEGSVWDPGDRIYLKVDVQGLEASVFGGAHNLLGVARVVEVELSTVRYYRGETLMPELLQGLYRSGLSLISFRPTDSDPRTGYLKQADVICLRRGA